ncbi:hypothetical protein AB434_0410 [Heyndrickxia coagulans]|uniref:Uncharacterized protein n=1 Tax=Heyndrickxia coagulans TaxID=1398 RepID=A0AAN0T2M8_HEYCO|nr:hypothetical protein SB48_HM08orf01189 [Heyndrickxia coagulans]AKN52815.1 hypothetical protein AB434_0410 [Heyndrickxia coagulans]KYC60199.1 hypothetical protein B4100_2148 [Heyndrickxia coagulans]
MISLTKQIDGLEKSIKTTPLLRNLKPAGPEVSGGKIFV